MSTRSAGGKRLALRRKQEPSSFDTLRAGLCCEPYVVESFSMSISSSPKIPSYRTTLFFGPEAHETNPDIVYCVFNVKKRSWKGGIQLVVEIAQPHAFRCKQILQLETWLRNILRHLPQEDYDEYFQRGQDLFLQCLCQEKLQLAIEGGLRQETTLLSHDVLSRELEDAIRQNGHALKETLFAELDVPSMEE